MSRRRLAVLALAALIVVTLLRGVLFRPGELLIGDHVTPRIDYVATTLSAWNSMEHGGAPEAINLSQTPALAGYAVVAAILGPALADRVLLALCFFVALLAFWWAISRWTPAGTRITNIFCAVFYAFNPWTAARVASGHFALLWAYALVPLLLRTSTLPVVQRTVFGASIGALIVADDLHIGELAAIGYAAAYIFEKAVTVRARVLGAVGFLLLVAGFSAWWIFGLLAIPGVHAPAPDSTVLAALARNIDPLTLLSLRIYWWNDFSRGLYEFGPLTNIVLMAEAFPAVVLILVALRWRRLPAVALTAALAASVTLCLQLSSRYMPAAYETLLRSPIMSPYRDPDKLTFIAVLSIAVAAAMVLDRYRQLSVRIVAIVLLGISLLPWASDGALRGRIAPQLSSESTRAAMKYLYEADPHALSLWIPAGPYIIGPTDPLGSQDPVRFQAQAPIANTYTDAAYDFTPGTSLFLREVENRIYGHQTQGLAALLARQGVQYVVIRRDVRLVGSPYRDPRYLPHKDFRVARTLRDVTVYENLRARHAGYQVGGHETLVTGDVRIADELLPHTELMISRDVDAESPYLDSELVRLDQMFSRYARSTQVTEVKASEGRGEWVVNADAGHASGPGEHTMTSRIPAASTGSVLVLAAEGSRAFYNVFINGALTQPEDGDADSQMPHLEAYRIPRSGSTIRIVARAHGIRIFGFRIATEKAFDQARNQALKELEYRYTAYLLPQSSYYRAEVVNHIGWTPWYGPIVVDKERVYQVHVASTSLHAWVRVAGGNKQSRRRIALHCDMDDLCVAYLTLRRGSYRFSFSTDGDARGAVISRLGTPPWVDNGLVGKLPSEITWHDVVEQQSYGAGWTTVCSNGRFQPQVANEREMLYVLPPGSRNCAAEYAPEAALWRGRFITLGTSVVSIVGLIAFRTQRKGSFAAV